jgi:hypothetical protein
LDPAARGVGGGGRGTRRGTPRARWKGALRFAGSALVRSPFVSLAVAALVIRYGFPLLGVGLAGGPAGWLWTGVAYVLWPFSIVATLIDPHLRGFPEWVDISVTLVLGLVPYAVLDALVRLPAIRRMRSGGR